METQRHVDQMILLLHSLRAGWEHRQDFYCAGNMFFYFSTVKTKASDFRGPDVFVVLGTTKKERKSWVVWEEEGRRPDLIIELTSDSTRRIDHVDKKELYAQLGVHEYFLFDPFSKELEGYVLDHGSATYVRMLPNERGWLRSRRLGLWLGVVPGVYNDTETEWLRWIDDDGRVFEHDRERFLRAEAERAAEERRAEDEARRAEEQGRRAEDEARRAAELAAKLAEYEAKFGKL
ncbi:Uma2 family endonuclease [Myxococcota bacterium]|nr:Uma2 family endonuclease [Myxococcota bacterium]